MPERPIVVAWVSPTPRFTWKTPKRSDLQPLGVTALADTGSLYLCIPESVKVQLQLEATSRKSVTTADGKRSLCDYVGPVRIRFENRECYVGAVVLGDEVLLGAVPGEDMDLVVSPPLRRVIVNPLHPNFAEARPRATVKRSRPTPPPE
jgi:clan AA aspartic protease